MAKVIKCLQKVIFTFYYLLKIHIWNLLYLLHYYYKLEQENRFAIDGMHKIFLYIESALIFGNIILALTFVLLAFSGISSLIAIGLYSAIIVVLSLLTDIFILPVMILETRTKWRELIVK